MKITNTPSTFVKLENKTKQKQKKKNNNKNKNASFSHRRLLSSVRFSHHNYFISRSFLTTAAASLSHSLFEWPTLSLAFLFIEKGVSLAAHAGTMKQWVKLARLHARRQIVTDPSISLFSSLFLNYLNNIPNNLNEAHFKIKADTCVGFSKKYELHFHLFPK